MAAPLASSCRPSLPAKDTDDQELVQPMSEHTSRDTGAQSARNVEFFATASPGTEAALGEELAELNFSNVRVRRNGVAFRGAREDGWRACLWSRIAQRIQTPVAQFAADSPEALYAGVAGVDWTPVLGPEQTLAVSAFCNSSTMTHSGFVALKTKDAIVDQVREACGARPNVDRSDPDVRVFLHLGGNRATVYLDLAGEALFRRGYRQDAGEAPLKETLAAAILRLSSWDRTSPLIDPLCGAGTIPIEAALWAGNVAPGLRRERFGFERWRNHDAEAAETMAELRHGARRVAHGQVPSILASDNDERALDMARANARTAGVRIAFRHRPVQELQADARRTLVTNPPYNLRLDTDPTFYRELGATIARLHDWRVGILAGTPELPRAITQRPNEEHRLRNGALDCRFLVYDIP